MEILFLVISCLIGIAIGLSILKIPIHEWQKKVNEYVENTEKLKVSYEKMFTLKDKQYLGIKKQLKIYEEGISDIEKIVTKAPCKFCDKIKGVEELCKIKR